MRKLNTYMNRLFLALISISIAFVSCNKENYKYPDKQGGEGQISLKIESKGSFTIPLKSSTVDVSTFKVNIKKDGVIVTSWTKYSDVPNVISLEIGTYTFEAFSSEGNVAAFDQPIYYGSQDFTIEPNKVSTINLTCKLSNMKVSILCSDAFKRELKDYVVTVSRSGKDAEGAPNTGFLDFDATIINANRSGYFAVAPLNINVLAYRVLDGSEVNHNITIDKVAAMDHHIIKLNAVETGDVAVGSITVDYSTNNIEHDVVIDGEDETPVDPIGPPVDPDPEPEPDPVVVPTVVGAGIESDLVLSTAEASTAVVDIAITTNKSGIAKLVVILDSPDLTPDLLLGMGIDPVNGFDMANLVPGTDLHTNLTDLGLLAGGDPKGKIDYKFSIGAFMPLLTPNTHKFHVAVTDGDGNETKKTLTVIRTE